MSGNWIKKERRAAIYDRDNCTCATCGSKVIPGISLAKAKGIARNQIATLNHIQPRNFGGNNKSENLITMCVSCNSSLKDGDLAEFTTDDQYFAIILQSISRI